MIKISPRKLEVMLELLIFGILLGITEDIIVVLLVTDARITWHVIGIVVLVAIPFAIVGEVLIDNIDFVSLFRRIFKKKVKN